MDPGPVAYRSWISPGQENAGKVTGFGDGKKAPTAIKLDEKVNVFPNTMVNQPRPDHASQECSDIGSASNSAITAVWLHDSELPGFRAFFEDIYLRLVALHVDILRALARGLDIDPERSLELCPALESLSSMRRFHPAKWYETHF